MECFTWQDRKTSKSASHPLPPPWTPKNVWQGANIKHKCFCGKKEEKKRKKKKTFNPHGLCCTPVSAWSYSFFSWNRLTFDWAKFGVGLRPEHCLPASYLIALSIWNHAKNTRAQQAVRKRRISHRVSRVLFYQVKGQKFDEAMPRVELPARSCISILSLNTRTHTHPILFIQDQCVIKVKLQLLFMTAEQFKLLYSPVKRRDMTQKEGMAPNLSCQNTSLELCHPFRLHITSHVGHVKLLQFILSIFPSLSTLHIMMCHSFLGYMSVYTLVNISWQCNVTLHVGFISKYVPFPRSHKREQSSVGLGHIFHITVRPDAVRLR